MNRINLLAMAVALLTPVAATLAAEQPLICFGNEPFWSLDLVESAGSGRVFLADGPAARYRAVPRATSSRAGKPIWRRRSGGKHGGELVAFLRDGAACSDGMSIHPVSMGCFLNPAAF